MGHVIDLARAHVSRKKTAKFVGKILQIGCPVMFPYVSIVVYVVDWSVSAMGPKN